MFLDFFGYFGKRIAEFFRFMDGNLNPSYGTIERKLPELFKIISTQMMGVALTERGIESALKENLFGRDSYNVYFMDKQMIKKDFLNFPTF